MTKFKKWLRQAYREPHTTFTEHNMEVAYLAGQASAEKRIGRITELHNGIVKDLQDEIAELELENRQAHQTIKRLDKECREHIADTSAIKAQQESNAKNTTTYVKELLKEIEALKAQAGEQEPVELTWEHLETKPKLYLHPTTERRVPEDVLSWIDGVLPVIEIFGTTPSQKQWSKDRTREARAWLNAAPAPTKENTND